MNLPTVASSSRQALIPTSIQEAMALAEMMAHARLVPEHLRGNVGDCLLVVTQAQRWGLDVVAVAQCTSVVHGKLCYEGKLVAAVLQAMGSIEGRLDYEIQGAGQAASITVTGTPRGGAPQSITGTVKQWRTYGKDKHGRRVDNAWDDIPEDMLIYRGTRQWARRYTPEALLGVYTPDEMEDERIVARGEPARRRKASSPAGDEDIVDAEFSEACAEGAGDAERRSTARADEQAQLLDPDQRQAELADAIDNAATLGQLETIANQIALLPGRNRAQLRERYSDRRRELREEAIEERKRREREDAEDAQDATERSERDIDADGPDAESEVPGETTVEDKRQEASDNAEADDEPAR